MLTGHLLFCRAMWTRVKWRMLGWASSASTMMWTTLFCQLVLEILRCYFVQHNRRCTHVSFSLDGKGYNIVYRYSLESVLHNSLLKPNSRLRFEINDIIHLWYDVKPPGLSLGFTNNHQLLSTKSILILWHSCQPQICTMFTSSLRLLCSSPDWRMMHKCLPHILCADL